MTRHISAVEVLIDVSEPFFAAATFLPDPREDDYEHKLAVCRAQWLVAEQLDDVAQGLQERHTALREQRIQQLYSIELDKQELDYYEVDEYSRLENELYDLTALMDSAAIQEAFNRVEAYNAAEDAYYYAKREALADERLFA